MEVQVQVCKKGHDSKEDKHKTEKTSTTGRNIPVEGCPTSGQVNLLTPKHMLRFVHSKPGSTRASSLYFLRHDVNSIIPMPVFREGGWALASPWTQAWKPTPSHRNEHDSHLEGKDADFTLKHMTFVWIDRLLRAS